ncbi:MAG: type I-E CRISPR-associated protein Cse2/CasB [Burkholderiales bacterium]|nr:type I-E CRISPR-associated protein Cse2/CasB [Burkholderiales bacterium]
MKLEIKRDNAAGEMLVKWWAELADDKGGRAELKRAADVTRVVMSPAYQRLHRMLCKVLPEGQVPAHKEDRLAIAAALLAHVKDDDSGASLPVLMSKREQESDRPPVSPLRFRRLLETTDVDDLFVGLRRVLPLLGHRVNVVALTNDLLNWGDATRKRWAYGYQWPQSS